MVGYLLIVVYVGLTAWVWVAVSWQAGLITLLVGFVLVNLVGPLVDRYIDRSAQRRRRLTMKAEANFQAKVAKVSLMSQNSGLPADLAFLFACVLLPPQKILLARFERVGKAEWLYLKGIRDIANAEPRWKLPVSGDDVDALRLNAFSRLDRYERLSFEHGDPYLADWVDRVRATYSGWWD